jgi:hypothetical protein
MFLFDFMKQMAAFNGGAQAAPVGKKDTPPPAAKTAETGGSAEKADPAALTSLFGGFAPKAQNDDDAGSVDAAIDEGRENQPSEEEKVITAAAVPQGNFPKEKSSFGGDLRPDDKPPLTDAKVNELAGQKMGKLAPGFCEPVGNGLYELTDASGNKRLVAIDVVDPDQLPKDENGRVAAAKTTDFGEEGCTIQISSKTLDDKHVARALAHELEEIRSGKPEEGDAQASALKPGAAADAEVSAHDRGRVAELRVMLDELKENKSGPGSTMEDRVAERRTFMEIDALASHLGLNEKAASTGKEDMKAAQDMRAQRFKIVESMLSDPKIGGDPEYAKMLKSMLRIDDDADEHKDEGVRMRVLDTEMLSNGKDLDPGHISATANGEHSSWCGKGNFQSIPGASGQSQAFPGGPDVPHGTRRGEYATEQNDNYLRAAQDADHVFDPSFIDPAGFVEAKQEVEATKGQQQAFVLRSFDAKGDLANQDQVPTPNGNVPVSDTEQGKSIQANNCGTDLVAKLRAQGVLGPADFEMLGMNPDGTYKQGQDVRPQDVMLHLRWREFEHLRNQEEKDA